MNPEPQDMSTEGVPEVEQEPRATWFFTFGADHQHPETGEYLGQAYVSIRGTCESTRTAMFGMFGNRWSNQYRTAEAAGVEQFKLHRVDLPLLEQASFEEQVAVHVRRLDAERTPVAAVEERTGVSDVQAEVLEEVEALRREIDEYGASMFEGTVGPSLEDLTARLDRIASAVQRGEQR